MLCSIYARDRKGGIGYQGGIPWNVPEDMKVFRALTEGATIVMGRLTWESLPKKPLPKRENYVVTSGILSEALVLQDPMEALELAKDRVVWLIGGSRVYGALHKHVDYIHETIIPGTYKTDTFVHVPVDGEERDHHFVHRNLISTATGMTLMTALYRNGKRPPDPEFESEVRRKVNFAFVPKT